MIDNGEVEAPQHYHHPQYDDASGTEAMSVSYGKGGWGGGEVKNIFGIAVS